MKIFCPAFIARFLRLLSLSGGRSGMVACLLFFAGCASSLSNPRNLNFERGKALVLAHDYVLARPYLEKSLEARDLHYDETLLLLAQTFDQLGLPDRSLLTSREFLGTPKRADQEFYAHLLILKNQTRLKIDILSNPHRKIIFGRAKFLRPEHVITGIQAASEFQCDRYCLDEISFFESVQVPLFYIVETGEGQASDAEKLIRSKYRFFHAKLQANYNDFSFKRRIAFSLHKSLSTLKNLELITDSVAGQTTKELFSTLSPIEKDLESWQAR